MINISFLTGAKNIFQDRYKVAHVKQPPLALRGNRKNTSFFVFLKFFHFCRRMPKQEQKQSKNWGKTCKILTFFSDFSQYATKWRFLTIFLFFPHLWAELKKNSVFSVFFKNFFFFFFRAEKLCIVILIMPILGHKINNKKTTFFIFCPYMTFLQMFIYRVKKKHFL